MPLRPSTTLSFSAGTASTDPYGYRVVEPGASPMEELARLDPTLLGWLFSATPLLINAYPAGIDPIPGVTFTDTYLSFRTGVRALALAALEGAPAIVVAQPLFLAELLLRATASGSPLPARLLLATGGYALPRSLHRALVRWTPGVDLRVVELYGIAEVDAACLVALGGERAPRWSPRRDIEVHLGADGGLSLRKKGATAWCPTGDTARATADGLLIEPARLGEATAHELEAWGPDDWARRTGYRVDGDWIPRGAGVDWTTKPDWR